MDIVGFLEPVEPLQAGEDSFVLFSSPDVGSGYRTICRSRVFSFSTGFWKRNGQEDGLKGQED